MRYIHLKSVDSTNNYIRNYISNDVDESEIIVVYSDEQKAGRGQKGNSWESEKNKNLTFSILCHPLSIPAPKQFILSEAISLSILDVLNDIKHVTKGVNAEDRFSVKWPNDIYYGNKKISGTLIECDLNGKTVSNCIIGSGVNINQSHFQSNAPNPISLCHIFDKEFDIKGILTSITNRFEHYFGMVLDSKFYLINSLYMQNLYRRDGYHPYRDKDGSFSARIKAVEATGHLVLETVAGELRRYEFKEVAFGMG